MGVGEAVPLRLIITREVALFSPSTNGVVYCDCSVSPPSFSSSNFKKKNQPLYINMAFDKGKFCNEFFGVFVFCTGYVVFLRAQK